MRLSNLGETQRFAERLAAQVRIGDVLLLSGEVGAGKTSFAQALIRAMAGQPELEVTSPTFTLLQTYDTPAGTVWHYDLYRLKDAEELEELALEEAMAQGITVVEWPEIAQGYLRQGYVHLAFSHLPHQEGRQVTVKATGAGERLMVTIRNEYGNGSASA